VPFSLSSDIRALTLTSEAHHERKKKHGGRRRKKRGEEENEMQQNGKKAKNSTCTVFSHCVHTLKN